MVDTVIHNGLVTTNNHNPFFRNYADQAARLADTSMVTDDLLKLAYQQSDSTIWLLTGLSPTVWQGYSPISVVHGLGSMYLYDASQVITINAVNQYHGVEGFLAGSQSEGVTYLASANGVITNTADNGGVLRCTDVGHGLTTGQYIVLNGMGDAAHVESTRVTVIDSDTFDCDDIAYNSSGDTGFWQRGTSLTVDSGHDGIYVITYSLSVTAAGNNKNLKIEMVQNTTGLDEFVCERKIAIQNDLGSMGSSGVVSLAVGDTIWMKAENTTDSVNFNIKHANVHIFKL